MIKYYSLLIIGLLATSPVFANSPTKREIVEELLQKLELIDPNIKSHKGDWLKVREHLEQAAQQSESIQGLRLSVQHILDQWLGLRFRVLDESDAQYWALNGDSITLPSAWLAQKGSRWVVQYSESDKLRRGDSFLQKDFAPFSKENQNSKAWTLPFPKPLTIDTKSKPLSDWALDLSQTASKTLIFGNKKVCVEKVWFWLTSSVAENLNSKMKSSLCKGILLDLRDVFGEGANSISLPKDKIPIAVLVNKSTREGAVKLVRALKKDAKAEVFGETTDTDRPLQKKEVLRKVKWSLIVVGDSGIHIPDRAIKDSYLNAEGVDDIKESALAWLKSQISG